MRRLVVAQTANQDLRTLTAYIAREAGVVAVGRHFASQLLRRCEKLAGLPGVLGVARPELGHDVRMAVHRGYLILFRYGADELRVLRIVEGHRDLAALGPAGKV